MAWELNKIYHCTDKFLTRKICTVTQILKDSMSAIWPKQCLGGVSIQAYCKKNNVPYNLFDKWYTDTRLMVVPVTVKGNLISTPTLGNHSGAV